jgi:hypothetical protein
MKSSGTLKDLILNFTAQKHETHVKTSGCQEKRTIIHRTSIINQL